MSLLFDIEKRCAEAIEYERAERQFRGVRAMNETELIRLIAHTAIGLDNPFESSGMSGRNMMIVQRLSEERTQREARAESWKIVAGTLSYMNKDEVQVEANPLRLGSGEADSYLEQVQINFPEVYPGSGEPIRAAIVLAIDLLKHLRRDNMTDAERVAIGWADIPKKEPV